MADIALCTQYGNYDGRKIHPTGIKYNPYDYVIGRGIVFANGDLFVGNGENSSPQPAVQNAVALNAPNCRTCHSGGC